MLSKILFCTIGLGFLVSCRSPGFEAQPLPKAWERQLLSEPDTLDLAEYLQTWHPKSWQILLISALHRDSSESRLENLKSAVALHTNAPQLWYYLALEHLAQHTNLDDTLAYVCIQKSMQLDPENGILALTQAVTESRLGYYKAARAVFRQHRGFPKADVYGEKLEHAILEGLKLGLRLNPYDLIESQGWYRNMPLPPIEEWSKSLEIIFLDPLLEHPYDIRLRGKEAALGLFRLGEKIVAGSLNPDRVFSDGREERLLGYMLMSKAAEFLKAYDQTFASISITEKELKPLQAQLFHSITMADALPESWNQLLTQWEKLEQQPGVTVAQACLKMQQNLVWRKVKRICGHFSDMDP